MKKLFDQFKRKVVSSLSKDDDDIKSSVEIDNKIALGVLLWAVAEADEKFLPEEEETIKKVLKEHIQIRDEDMPIILNTIEIANIERIDYHKFTREVGQNLRYDLKVDIIRNLFRVACVDKQLDNEEIETIRTISGLFGVDHKDFINAKIEVKKEFGMGTSGL